MLLPSLVLVVLSAAYAQENAQRNISPSLLECYEPGYLARQGNEPPRTLSALLAMLRKIERTEGFQMSVRGLSVALLHRFRQEGIVENPRIATSDGVTPYAPLGFMFYRHARTLRLIPGNALLFRNNSLNVVERCTLHNMLSSSIAIFRRGDEGTACKFPRMSALSRWPRDVEGTDDPEVETLTSEEIAAIADKQKKETDVDESTDPNSVYPELPPNHPNNQRLLQQFPWSECPLENGVIKTPWGDIAGGQLLAGIAAGFESQMVRLGDLFREENSPEFAAADRNFLQEHMYASEVILDNKWFATLAGDLAEVALMQGPSGAVLSVGVNGTWNSTTMPRWYLLHSNTNLSMTTAEIRGGLDGLILAQHVEDLHSRIPNLRLSQILDMYYSPRGFFNQKIRACDRRRLFTSVAPNETMSAQVYAAALVLQENLAGATLRASAIERFAVEAASRLAAYVPSSMNDDSPCPNDNGTNAFSVNLTIILDTTWPFNTIQPILAALLEEMEINPFDSSFTVINSFDGQVMINSSQNVLDFYEYNETSYANVTRGFDLPHSLEILGNTRTKKLEEERDRAIGGGNSDVVLIVPYRSSISATDREYCMDRLKRLREESPDTTILILAQGSKDAWSNFVNDAEKDLFSIGSGDIREALLSIVEVTNRIRQVPKRLINTQCGGDYIARGSSKSFVDYVRPQTTKLYSIHPNYFFSSDGSSIATIKVQPAPGWGTLRVCSSRDFSTLINNSTDSGISCTTVKDRVESVTVSCSDATYIHECPSLYFSVAAVDNSDDFTFRCTDPVVCRFPDAIKYTFSYENLRCASNANIIASDRIYSVLLLFVAFCFSR